MRKFLFTILIIPLLGFSLEISAILNRLYNLYKENIIQPTGRVIDWQNHAVTHSEGIGYSLFFAVALNDKRDFYKILNWFEKNIGFNSKNLIPWLWGKDAQGKWHVLDSNDATDGNMWIAYSLLLAYEKWGDKTLKRKALKLIKAIKKYDIYSHKGCIVLLPGSKFFVSPSHLTINPSYYAPFIFDKFYSYDKDNIWKILSEQSLKIWYYIYVSPYFLFPDWVELDIHTCRVTKLITIEGFNSIRIPIWILYSSYKNSKLENILIERIFKKVEIINNNTSLFCKLTNLEPKSCKDFIYAAYSGYQPEFLSKIDWQKHKKNYYLLALTLFNLIFLTNNY